MTDTNIKAIQMMNLYLKKVKMARIFYIKGLCQMNGNGEETHTHVQISDLVCSSGSRRGCFHTYSKKKNNLFDFRYLNNWIVNYFSLSKYQQFNILNDIAVTLFMG